MGGYLRQTDFYTPDGDKNALFKYGQEKMTNICYVYLFVHLLIYYLLRTNGEVALTYYPITRTAHPHKEGQIIIKGYREINV